MGLYSDITISSSLFISGVVAILIRITPHNPTRTPPISVITQDNPHDHDTESSSDSHSTTTATSQPPAIGQAHPSSKLPEFGGCIYLDYNATSPVFPEVTRTIEPFISNYFGNPSSTHAYSLPCQEAIQSARINIGQLIHAPDPLQTIYFSSCGSEADNRAIDIALHHFQVTDISAAAASSSSSSSSPLIEHYQPNTPHQVLLPKVVTSAIEHPAVLLYLYHLQKTHRINLEVIPVDREGFVNLTKLQAALSRDTALVTVMHSNNEVGTIQPLQEIGSIVQQFNACTPGAHILLHSDAAQSLGKVAVDVEAAHVDLLTIVGHKFGTPKGIAALFIRENVKTCPILIGGGQERGLRAGTENVAFIAALGVAARIARDEEDQLLLHMLTLKGSLLAALSKCRERCQDESLVRFNGPTQCNSLQSIADSVKLLRAIQMGNLNQNQSHGNRNANRNSNRSSSNSSIRSSGLASAASIVEQLPNTVSVSFRGIKAHELMHELAGQVACSAGSACHASDAGSKLSYVLEAMQIDPEYGLGTLRLSLGRHSTAAEIESAGEAIANAVVKLHSKKI